MGRNRVFVAALLTALALATSSCAGWQWWLAGGAAVFVVPNSRLDPLYHEKYHGAGLMPLEGNSEVLLGHVEFDDYGWYRDRQQPRLLLEQLQALSADENSVVVLYMHGWRHNSSDGDRDMELFRNTLLTIFHEVRTPGFAEMRRRISGRSDARIVGIAIGWRGQAWPEMQRWLPVVGHLVDLPVYPTAIGRKATAEVIGHADLQDFVSNLADLHRERWLAAAKPTPAPLMSLVMVGHSFGGHALFGAMVDRIENNLTGAIVGVNLEKAEGLGKRAIPVAARLDALPGGIAPTDTCRRLVQNIGDLVVLINPAIEAASYKNVDALVRSARFRSDQPPVLVTISSKNDGARNVVFRGLRFVTNFLRASLGEDQRKMERLALGAYDPHRTNSLELIDQSKKAKDIAKRKIGPRGLRDTLDVRITEAEMASEFQALIDKDLSTSLDLGNVRLSPVGKPVAHSPAMVVNTSSALVNGHSDFFREEFIRWLSGYVLRAQLKRLAHNPKLRAIGSTPSAD